MSIDYQEYCREMKEKMDRNWKKIEESDKQAKAKGKLVGRYIKHAYADGYAIYQIIKENKKTVRIRVCSGIGDDWVLPAWGEEATIAKTLALNFIRMEDSLKELFS